MRIQTDILILNSIQVKALHKKYFIFDFCLFLIKLLPSLVWIIFEFFITFFCCPSLFIRICCFYCRVSLFCNVQLQFVLVRCRHSWYDCFRHLVIFITCLTMTPASSVLFSISTSSRLFEQIQARKYSNILSYKQKWCKLVFNVFLHIKIHFTMN